MTELEVVPTKARKSVSHSEVEAYLRCERNHFYGYGLEIQRIQTSDSLAKGILGHAVMEHYFNLQMQWQADGSWSYTTEELSEDGSEWLVVTRDRSGEAYDLTVAWLTAQDSEFVFEIMEAFAWFFTGQQFINWTIQAVEHEFVLTVSEDYELPLVVDMIAVDPFGKTWVIDHKFMYDFINDKDAALMPQLAKYVGALRALGFKIDRAGYSQMRTRKLKTPTVDTMYQFREEPLTDQRVSRTFIEQVVASTRIQARKQAVIDNPEEGLANWSYEALRVGNKMVCNSCSFREVCVSELSDTPGETQAVLDLGYQKKVRREVKNRLREIEAE